jgi:uracil-DNA glycosylase
VLRTFFRSLREDLGYRLPVTGSLDSWARQGVLLLNAILSVKRDRPESHKERGWEAFTQAVLRVINERKRPAVFALFGQQAQKRRSLVREERHAVVTAENPEVTPEKFLDAKVFSAINDALELRGQSAVYWQLPYV